MKTSSATGIAVTSLGLASCQQTDKKEATATDDNDVNQFADNFELNEITIDELQQKMQSGTYTARSITELYLKRIETIDKKNQQLNSIIEINPDALTIADANGNSTKISGNGSTGT